MYVAGYVFDFYYHVNKKLCKNTSSSINAMASSTPRMENISLEGFVHGIDFAMFMSSTEIDDVELIYND